MKRLILAIIATAALPLQAQAQSQPLRIAATPVPHAQILEFVRPSLAAQGVELDIKVFTDYVQPNVQLAEGRLDANFFQNRPYLAAFNAARGTTLVDIAGVHIEPFGAYSKKISRIEDLKQGASVVIPNEATNTGRALLLLQSAGLVTLKPGSGVTATPRDIIDNPKRLKIRELEAATLPRVLGQVDLALINTNYALEAGLNPMEDALVIEHADSPFVNVLVSREDNKDSPALKKLVEALRSDEVKQFIERTYGGAVVPAG